MSGRPVWLASASLRDRRGKLVPSSQWRQDPRTVDRLERILRRVLTGVGDFSAERFFRMPITACLHRALSSTEETKLPESWMNSPAVDLAGGGVEMIWSKVGEPLSCQPCHDPGRTPLPGEHPDCFIIEECGSCEPCQARLAVRHNDLRQTTQGGRP